MNKIGINKFVLRQIKGTGKSYLSNWSFEDVLDHAQEQLDKNQYKKGYRDGVLLIPVAKKYIDRFVCPIVKITPESTLTAIYTKRRSNEDSYIQIRCSGGQKLPTNSVDLIIYRNDVLKETNENTTTCNWELIAFIAKPEKFNDLPMGPVTMMRNQMQLTGGTKGNYKSKDWASSVKFWNEYAVSNEI